MWKICHERTRLNLRKEIFPNRAVTMWSVLPGYAVNAPGVDSFKNRLDKQWSNAEIIYTNTKQPHHQDAKYLHRLAHDLTIEAKACDHEDTY